MKFHKLNIGKNKCLSSFTYKKRTDSGKKKEYLTTKFVWNVDFKNIRPDENIIFYSLKRKYITMTKEKSLINFPYFIDNEGLDALP
jgi:hypothetical protein